MDTSITAAVGIAGLAGTIFYYAVIKPLTGAIADLRELIHDMREDLQRNEEKTAGNGPAAGGCRGECKIGPSPDRRNREGVIE